MYHCVIINTSNRAGRYYTSIKSKRRYFIHTGIHIKQKTYTDKPSTCIDTQHTHTHTHTHTLQCAVHSGYCLSETFPWFSSCAQFLVLLLCTCHSRKITTILYRMDEGGQLFIPRYLYCGIFKICVLSSHNLCVLESNVQRDSSLSST